MGLSAAPTCLRLGVPRPATPQARAAAAAGAAPVPSGLRASFNPAYDAEDAASVSSGATSTAKLGRASPL